MHHRHSDENDPALQGFRPSYKASHHDHGEHLLLVETLSGFYADSLIDDVLRLIKGEKKRTCTSAARTLPPAFPSSPRRCTAREGTAV
jgi:hypothetical protein